MRRLLLLISLLAIFVAVPGHALAADPPPDADYTEEYIPDGPVERLHADVFRPKGYDKSPVIVTVSPYTGHATNADAGPPYWDPSKSGPSDRFYDFLNGSGVLKRGYAYVMVDLPGYGGSSGCGDWGGPREQQAVRTAVEWAAKQPWSTGKVALFGKSYDGWTGIMGVADKPSGLAAVVSMEPVYSGYRYFWTNGVRINNTLATSPAFRTFDLQPGSPSDDPNYHGNQVVTASPGCQASGVAIESADPAEDSLYWAPRNLIPRVQGSTVPLFLTQGFLEDNTKPDGAFDVFNGVKAYKRAWFGQFKHWRGYEREGEDQDGPYKTGRDAFMGELNRWLDHHLMNGPKPVADPTVEVQSAPDGRWRAEELWPPADAVNYTSVLKTGSFGDDGEGSSSETEGIWSFSPALPHRMHLAGEPVLRGTLSTPVRANFVVNLYDVDADNKAVLISRMAALAGSGEFQLKLYGQDWILERGHRLGVRFTDANVEWWRHVPTQQTMTVDAATLTLPFLTYERTDFLTGGATADLENHMSGGFDLDPGLITEGETPFELPPKLAPMPGKPGGGAATKLTAKAKYARKSRRLTVSGAAASGQKVTVTVKRGKKRVARRTVTARNGSYRVKLKLRKRGRYVVVVSSGTQKARTRVRA